MEDKTKWLAFTTKMKWVILGTIATVLAAAGNELAEVFPVAEHPWVGIVLVAVPAIAGYLPKEKNPDANA